MVPGPLSINQEDIVWYLDFCLYVPCFGITFYQVLMFLLVNMVKGAFISFYWGVSNEFKYTLIRGYYL